MAQSVALTAGGQRGLGVYAGPLLALTGLLLFLYEHSLAGILVALLGAVHGIVSLRTPAARAADAK